MDMEYKTISHYDFRTGRGYSTRFNTSLFGELTPDIEASLREDLINKANLDYFKTLTLQEKIQLVKRKPEKFTCPFCQENTEITSRKEKLITGSLFVIIERLEDIFKCKKCNREFTNKELIGAQNSNKQYNDDTIILMTLEHNQLYQKS